MRCETFVRMAPASFAGIASLVLVLVAGVTASPRVGDGNVVQVHAVFRHGERTPADTYPLDPYINHTFYPVGWGQLTLRGKRQVLEQGRFLRSRYSSLLGDIYSPDVVDTKSTDVDRSLMTASLVLAALFPPGPSQLIEDGLNWQPAPVHTIPLPLDNLLLVRITCPRYYEERARVLASAPTSELLSRSADLLRHLSEVTGNKIATLDDVQDIYSTLLAEERFNLTLPEWTHDIYPARLVNMTSYSFIANVQTTLLQRLKAGPLLNRIVTLMQQRSRGEKSKRMLLYSGHDSTVANLLAALGNLHAPYIPGYNALLLLELVEPSPGSFTVRFFRRSEEHREPELLRLEGCAEECPLEDFLRITQPVRPGDWHTECEAHDPNYVPPTPSPP